MARRRRARRNPRNSKGRFTKRARRTNPKRRRRVARANPAHKRRRRARANPSPVRRRRRARRNPSGVRFIGPRTAKQAKSLAKRRRTARAKRGMAEQKIGTRRAKARSKRRTKKQIAATNKMIRANRGGLAKRRAKSKRKGGSRRWKHISKGIRIVRRYKSKIRRAGKKRSLRRSIARVQYERASVIRRAGGKSVVAKAMHLKMNPGLAGVMTSAKVLLPQGAVAAGAMIGLAMGGKKIASMIPATTRASLGGADKFVPAASTLLLTGVGYVIADKVAPKFKGAVAIGGIIGAIVQAIVASVGTNATGFAAKARDALLGEYTMVGGGIFRGTSGYHTDGVGEYTMVGDTGRPRGGERDNGTNWALNGVDDHTEFAPGEGGVLAGSGMFRDR